MKKSILIPLLILSYSFMIAQGTPCTTTTIYNEQFNDTNGPIGANTNVIYGGGSGNHNNSMIISGSFFGWFNVINGVSNVDVYNPYITGFTVGCYIDASIWIRESFGGTNVTISLIDDSGSSIASTTLTLISSYQQINLNAQASTTGLTYNIHFNGTGGGGKDIAIEDLLITQTCNITSSFSTNYTNSCLSDNIFLFDASGSTPATDIISYNWDFGDGTIDSGINTTHSYSSAGTYSATLTTTNSAGCSDTEAATLVVYPNPAPVILGNINYCPMSSTLLDAGSGYSAYIWSTGATSQTINASISDNPINITVNDSNGCQGTSTDINVILEDLPNSEFSSDITFGCAPISINFFNTDTVLGQDYNWNFGNGSTQNGQENNATNNYLSNGCFDVSLEVISDQGCSSTTNYTEMICVDFFPTANFNIDPPYISIGNGEVIFTNNSLAAETYLWDFGDGTSSTDENPYTSYADFSQGDIQICLIAASEIGCVDTLCKTIIIKDIDGIYIPNVFTPNNDGINDKILPIFNAPDLISQYQFYIYNRWGQKVFETSDPYNSIGWDGTKHEDPCPEGVYTWILRATVKSNNERKNTHGHISLFR